MVIFITDGVGEGDVGMGMVFYHPEQARIEACDSLSALHQHDLCEPSVVVVVRHSNTPFILGECVIHFIWTWAFYPWVLLLPNSL